ncbi:uncharacterized protein LOC106659683 [Trichogramma pretiosum]|uniref:uncharacterized protein LOC106659683 n=1 Tax=Trichogramma pretiosum TaxID=7493 RepID=UPI0006C9BEE6|nr:uncharacterized protein LOC106659683 [Trichogramma pretiosum]
MTFNLDEETPKWHAQLIALLQRFWELEDVPPAQRSSPTDSHCEQMFAQHQRDNTGRYVVRLPVKPDAARTLGTSEASARATLRNLHRRMNRQPEFAEEYRLFMDTYEQMGHIRRLQLSEIDAPESHSNYIPHHGIWQQGNDGPKLRVVFDASRPTSTEVSLNDVFCRGPKLQRDIWTVLLRWRTYKFAFCADIRMMFRQICVDERDGVVEGSGDICRHTPNISGRLDIAIKL